MKAGTVSGGRRGRDMAGNRIGLRVALPAGFHSQVRWDTQLVNGVLPVRTGGHYFDERPAGGVGCDLGGRRNRRFNEDSVGWSDHALWVVDGATSLDTTSGRLETSARWISTETSRILGRIMSQSAGYCVPPARVGAVAQCLRERWENTAPVHDNGTLLPPAASLGLVQIDSEAGRAGLLSVGDCMVFHAGPEGDVRSIVVDETTMRAEQRRVAARGERPHPQWDHIGDGAGPTRVHSRAWRERVERRSPSGRPGHRGDGLPRTRGPVSSVHGRVRQGGEPSHVPRLLGNDSENGDAAGSRVAAGDAPRIRTDRPGVHSGRVQSQRRRHGSPGPILHHQPVPTRKLKRDLGCWRVARFEGEAPTRPVAALGRLLTG